MNMRESDEYKRMVHRHHIEAEWKFTEHGVDQLFQLSRDDPVVHAHIEAWRFGNFRSLEDMLCKLAVRLALNNKELREQVVTLAMQTGCFPKSIELSEENDRET